ncbi:MAG TPA: four helix bundle protein [Levilinea sp.]|nr:four helix bundle protein [Levilinea sp.]
MEIPAAKQKPPVRSYRDLIVWQKGIELAKRIYMITKKFPSSEVYGLTNQLRRAAVSIPSNIAEGQSRQSTKEFIHFLHISLGSLSELDTQIVIAKELEYLSDSDYQPRMQLLNYEK